MPKNVKNAEEKGKDYKTEERPIEDKKYDPTEQITNALYRVTVTNQATGEEITSLTNVLGAITGYIRLSDEEDPDGRLGIDAGFSSAAINIEEIEHTAIFVEGFWPKWLADHPDIKAKVEKHLAQVKIG